MAGCALCGKQLKGKGYTCKGDKYCCKNCANKPKKSKNVCEFC